MVLQVSHSTLTPNLADGCETLLDAHDEKNRWPGIYESTIGLIFFWTPFRGSGELTQQTILRPAEREFGEGDVLEKELRTSQEEDESLVGLADRYLRVARQSPRPRVACFYEQKPPHVAIVISRNVRHVLLTLRFWLTRSSKSLIWQCGSMRAQARSI